MLEIVRNIIPEIYCFCLSAYRNHSILQFGNFSLMSRVGPQQGDPLAGLLFCLAIQRLLRATRSAFTSGYMDDIDLGGNIRDVARDIDFIRTEGEAIELFLNNKKCEIISRSDARESDDLFEIYFLNHRLNEVVCMATSLSRPDRTLSRTRRKKFF